MGAELSQSEIETAKGDFLNHLPSYYLDVGIDNSLLRYSWTDSSARLVEDSSFLKSKLSSDLPAYIEKTATVLKGFTPVPNAVGLGAFIIAMVLQMVFSDLKGSGSGMTNPADMLRNVFAEEKASTVRNLMDEYMKRYRMHLRDDNWLLVDSMRLETQLSLQLTTLRNSMLLDGQMSSRAVKHWVNGAAFHAQALLHIARLRKRTEMGTQGFESAKRAASGALDTYQRDMSQILQKYKDYKRSTFWLGFTSYYCVAPSMCPASCDFREKKIAIHGLKNHHICRISANDHIDYIFSNHKQLRELTHYFSNLQNNLEDLSKIQGAFQIA